MRKSDLGFYKGKESGKVGGKRRRRETKSSASFRNALPEPFDLGRGVRPEVDCTLEDGAQGRVLDLAGVGAVVIKVRFLEKEG